MTTMRKSFTDGFTLVEVLVAVAIVSLALGVILRSSSLQILTISRATTRYQAMLYASSVLEVKLAQRVGDSTVEDEVGSYSYSLETSAVTADPRVQQVRVVVNGKGNVGVSLAAYRLRIRGDDGAKK